MYSVEWLVIDVTGDFTGVEVQFCCPDCPALLNKTSNSSKAVYVIWVGSPNSKVHNRNVTNLVQYSSKLVTQIYKALPTIHSHDMLHCSKHQENKLMGCISDANTYLLKSLDIYTGKS